jgi:hypothetical protein
MHRAWLNFRFQPPLQSLGLLPCSVASGDLAAAAISAYERMFRLKIHKELFENKRFQCYPFYFFTCEIFSG